MPRDTAEVKVEPKPEFENHCVVLGLSDDYILVYILPSLSVTELVIARDMAFS